jgi:HEAT repeat protein
MVNFPESNSRIVFQVVIDALLDNNKPFPPKYLHRFSDMSPEAMAELQEIWSDINTDRRANLLADLEDLAETDTLMSFEDISRFALKDSDARVRAVATRLLWECDDQKLIPVFLDMAKNDSDDVARATAAGALGLFVYLGEVGKISRKVQNRVEDGLLAIISSQETDLVRRRALEAMGYSSRDEIYPLIQEAYKGKSNEWRASALFAMGRSANEKWSKAVLKMLDEDDKEVHFEAIRAAGELEISAARSPLLEMLEEPEELDEDIRLAVVWSLSQIGGQNVRDVLETVLENTEDEEEAEYIENALDNLSFSEGSGLFGLLDLDHEDDNDSDETLKIPKIK